MARPSLGLTRYKVSLLTHLQSKSGVKEQTNKDKDNSYTKYNYLYLVLPSRVIGCDYSNRSLLPSACFRSNQTRDLYQSDH